MSRPADYAPVFATAHTQPGDSDVIMFADAYLDAVQQELTAKLAAASNDIIFNITSKPSYGNAWSPEAGLAWASVRENLLAEAALQLGLAYARLGADGEVKANLPEKTRLFFEGYLFEASGLVDLSFSNGKISLVVKKYTQKISWFRQGNKWGIHNIQHAPEQPFLNWTPAIEADDNYSAYVIYPGNTVNQEQDWPYVKEILPYSTEKTIRDASEIRAAQDYIRTFAPRCVNWVKKITAGVLLHENTIPGMFSSHSSFQRPGLIWIGSGVNSALGGELLVHECSHQYLNLYKLLGSVVNGKDEQLYYSPIKRASRPLEAVLYAAHATINMLLYHAEAIQNGANPETHVKRIQFLFPAFIQTNEPLENTNGLSELGRVLYDLSVAELEKHDFSWVEKEAARLA